MPFDSTHADAPADPAAVFRQRREAAAQLWETVPAERWNMQRWRCGTTACALGWLACTGHGGWTWFQEAEPVGPDLARSAYHSAADYFGISCDDAIQCFGPTVDSVRFHRRARIADVTAADVARTLLALPYAVPAPDRDNAGCYATPDAVVGAVLGGAGA